jgi:hypothetical protein
VGKAFHPLSFLALPLLFFIFLGPFSGVLNFNLKKIISNNYSMSTTLYFIFLAGVSTSTNRQLFFQLMLD